jgi:hypothetical protein
MWTARDGFASRTVCIVALLAASLTSVWAVPVAFTIVTSTDLSLPEPTGYVVQDFDQDGNLDVFITTRLFKGDGTGSLTPSSTVNFAQAAGIAAADFNADGYLDVVVTQDFSNKLSIYGDACGSSIGIALFV